MNGDGRNNRSRSEMRWGDTSLTTAGPQAAKDESALKSRLLAYTWSSRKPETTKDLSDIIMLENNSKAIHLGVIASNP